MKRTGLLAVLGLLVAAAGMVSADAPFTVVVGGLDSPRGLVLGGDDEERLYVAQAGTGANDGRITEIRHFERKGKAKTRDIATGLPSVGDEGEFIGVSGLSVNRNGTLYAMMSLSNAGTGFPSLLGHLLKIKTGDDEDDRRASRRVTDVANVGDFMYKWTGDHENLFPDDFPDSNPYAILATGSVVYVTDAGANTLSVVRADHHQQVLAYFPNNAIRDSTPTCIAKGPDGALYVGTLALVDSLVMGPRAIVYRIDLSKVVPDDLTTILSVARPWATGLWPINGCAFGPNGNLYVSELITSPDFSGGDVVKIPFRNPSSHVSLTNQMMTFGGGVAVDEDGTVYAVNGSIGTGSVIRLKAN